MHWTCYENHVLSMTMVIRIELRIFDQIVTSVSFGPNNGIPPKCWNLLWRRLCGKQLHWQSCRLGGGGGGSYLFTKYDVFKHNADFFKERSWSALIIYAVPNFRCDNNDGTKFINIITWLSIPFSFYFWKLTMYFVVWKTCLPLHMRYATILYLINYTKHIHPSVSQISTLVFLILFPRTTCNHDNKSSHCSLVKLSFPEDNNVNYYEDT